MNSPHRNVCSGFTQKSGSENDTGLQEYVLAYHQLKTLIIISSSHYSSSKMQVLSPSPSFFNINNFYWRNQMMESINQEDERKNSHKSLRVTRTLISYNFSSTLFAQIEDGQTPQENSFEMAFICARAAARDPALLPFPDPCTCC